MTVPLLDEAPGRWAAKPAESSERRFGRLYEPLSADFLLSLANIGCLR